jgi:hypothetical protein
MHTLVKWSTATLVAAAATVPTQAADQYPWRQHKAPFDFTFGNEIDGHQQSTLTQGGSLRGYLYVTYTGVVTKDGYAIATHANCSMGAECSVGWTFAGVPVRAKLVLQPMHDHPLFWIPRQDIPQPGAFAHFHWTGMAMPMPYLDADGYALELVAVRSFCFIHHGSEAATAGLSCRDNGGIAVQRGIDLATHLNILPNAPTGP